MFKVSCPECKQDRNIGSKCHLKGKPPHYKVCRSCASKKIMTPERKSKLSKLLANNQLHKLPSDTTENDLRNCVFNSWLIMHFSHRTTHQCFWRVKCLNCAEETTKVIQDIQKHKCQHCWWMPKGKVGLKRLYLIYKNSAKNNKRVFDLNIEEFQQLTSSSCYYCGLLPNKISSAANKKSHWGDYAYNGIDRKNNDIGYTSTNCLSCCTMCNFAKSNKTFNEFCEYLERIRNYVSC